MTEVEKKEQTIALIGFGVSLVVAYFVYDFAVDPLGTAFGLSKAWRIGLGIFEFFVIFGLWNAVVKSADFLKKADAKLNADISSAKPDSVEKKLLSLKRLRESDAITEKEFQAKKKKLLEKM